MNIQRIIDIVKTIREDAPTMSSGTAGFSGTSNATGPVAGFDPKMGAVQKRYLKGGKNSRKNWLDNLKK